MLVQCIDISNLKWKIPFRKCSIDQLYHHRYVAVSGCDCSKPSSSARPNQCLACLLVSCIKFLAFGVDSKSNNAILLHLKNMSDWLLFFCLDVPITESKLTKTSILFGVELWPSPFVGLENGFNHRNGLTLYIYVGCRYILIYVQISSW